MARRGAVAVGVVVADLDAGVDVDVQVVVVPVDSKSVMAESSDWNAYGESSWTTRTRAGSFTTWSGCVTTDEVDMLYLLLLLLFGWVEREGKERKKW